MQAAEDSKRGRYFPHAQAQGLGAGPPHVHAGGQPGRQPDGGRAVRIGRGGGHGAAQRINHRHRRAGQRARERGRAAVGGVGEKRNGMV